MLLRISFIEKEKNINKRKLVLEALLALSLTTLLSTVVYAEKTHQPEGNTVISEKDKPSITLAMDKWAGENDIVFNVKAKDTKVELLEMYIYSNGSSIGSIYVKPDKAVDDSGNETITISNNELKNIKTLIGPDNQTFNWSQIEQIEMVFSFSKGEELSSFKTVYVPVHILETPTPINPDKTDKTETVKNDTNNKTTVKQTSSTAVKTGDNTNITPYVSLLVVSVVVIIGIVVYKKKSSKK